MDPLDTLIEQEAAKLRLLKEKFEQQEKRVATLKGMRGGDDMDAFLAGKLATTNASPAPVAKSAPAAAAVPDDELRPRRKGQTKDAILSALGPVAQHLQDVHKRASANAGRDLNYKHVRTQVWHFAQGDEPLVESTKAGFYRLNEQGVAYVEKLKGENPGATGFSGATKSRKDDK